MVELEGTAGHFATRRDERRQNGMKYFLAKTEPGVYSIDQLEADGKTVWDGVTNPQAVRAILSMEEGDRVFIYHSGGLSSIVGVARVAKAGRPDPKNAKSAVADLEFLMKLDPPTTLAEVKGSNFIYLLK